MYPFLVFGGFSITITSMVFINFVFCFIVSFTKKRLLISLESFKTFDRVRYSKNYELIKGFSAKTIDFHYKSTLLDSIKNIEIYYKDLTEEKSYEVIKAVPLILDLLGLNFKSDPDSFWLNLGVFLKINHEICCSNIEKISKPEIEDMYKLLAKKLAKVIFNGVKDKSFFKAFPDILTHINYIPLFTDLMEKEGPLFIYEYLSNSTVQLENIVIVDHTLDVIFQESYNCIYSLVATEILLKALEEEENTPIDENLNLFSFLDFVTINRLVGKTEISILKSFHYY